MYAKCVNGAVRVVSGDDILILPGMPTALAAPPFKKTAYIKSK